MYDYPLSFVFLSIFIFNAYSQAISIEPTVKFERVLLDNSWYGDYGLRSHDINSDGLEDIVAYAWKSGNLSWFVNPFHPGVPSNEYNATWTEINIGNFEKIVDIDFADVDNNGTPDLVIAWDCNIPPVSENEGQIGWVSNPGSTAGEWLYYPIASKNSNPLPGVHRVRYGNFIGSEFGVIGIPIFDYGAKGPFYNNTAVSITYYSRPDDPGKYVWSDKLLNNDFHICHTVRKFKSETGQDFLIDNCEEGIIKMNFTSNGVFKTDVLNTGMAPVSYSPFYGSQGTSLEGNFNGEPAFFGQIAPWEGVNILSASPIAILVPENPGQSLFDAPLKRIDLDVMLGPQTHDVATGNFNTNNDCDDFIVGQRGPVEGIWMYQCNPENINEWSFFPIELNPGFGASQLVVVDFNNDKRMDFASTGFPGFGNSNTGGHFVAVYFNTGNIDDLNN